MRSANALISIRKVQKVMAENDPRQINIRLAR
jgi:hypothetical protein